MRYFLSFLSRLRWASKRSSAFRIISARKVMRRERKHYEENNE